MAHSTEFMEKMVLRERIQVKRKCLSDCYLVMFQYSNRCLQDLNKNYEESTLFWVGMTIRLKIHKKIQLKMFLSPYPDFKFRQLFTCNGDFQLFARLFQRIRTIRGGQFLWTIQQCFHWLNSKCQHAAIGWGFPPWVCTFQNFSMVSNKLLYLYIFTY